MTYSRLRRSPAIPATWSNSPRCWWWAATRPLLGTPTIAGAIVAGEVLEQGRGPKVIAFKKRRRKNSRRKRGHRQEFTLVRITEILTDGKKPSQTPPPRAKKPRPPKPAAEAAGSRSRRRAEMTKSGDDFVTKIGYVRHQHGL